MKPSDAARRQVGADTPPPLDADTLALIANGGDLAQLTQPQRDAYYLVRCAALKLDPHTGPLQYMRVREWDAENHVAKYKTILYATKHATDQLRQLHHVDIVHATLTIENQIAMVQVTGQLPDGRKDMDVGVVALTDYYGSELFGFLRGNAIMGAFTKAKRRLTLSITGSGLLDETEVEDMSQTGDAAPSPLAPPVEIPNTLLLPSRASAEVPPDDLPADLPTVTAEVPDVTTTAAPADDPAGDDAPTAPASDPDSDTNTATILLEVDALYRQLRKRHDPATLAARVNKITQGAPRHRWSPTQAVQVRDDLTTLHQAST